MGREAVDVVAPHSGVTVDELAAFDVTYTPPFPPVGDPLLMTARRVRQLT